MIGKDCIMLLSEQPRLHTSEHQHIASVYISGDVLDTLKDLGFVYSTNQWEDCNRLSMRLPPPLYDLTIRATMDPEYGLIGELRKVSQTIPNRRTIVTTIVDSVYETWWDSEDVIGLANALLVKAADIHKEHIDAESKYFEHLIGISSNKQEDNK